MVNLWKVKTNTSPSGMIDEGTRYQLVQYVERHDGMDQGPSFEVAII
ncbi:hypothetical protein F441_20482 [Phytophthora nicotianae CJ01A1]|uniref:Uncharacterized protein n=1 Tax=Phytophthora nicotianae CJ01A1 TaxID=1317063 RepID=W2VVY3_PHYNI|nr:hypothetical protein F441_20482 [Phytophthora nicotianae CJ01A1]